MQGTVEGQPLRSLILFSKFAQVLFNLFKDGQHGAFVVLEAVAGEPQPQKTGQSQGQGHHLGSDHGSVLGCQCPGQGPCQAKLGKDLLVEQFPEEIDRLGRIPDFIYAGISAEIEPPEHIIVLIDALPEDAVEINLDGFGQLLDLFRKQE